MMKYDVIPLVWARTVAGDDLPTGVDNMSILGPNF
jgi:hypothetical protein